MYRWKFGMQLAADRKGKMNIHMRKEPRPSLIVAPPDMRILRWI